MDFNNIELADQSDINTLVELHSLCYKSSVPYFIWNTPEWIAPEIEKGHIYVVRDQTRPIASMGLEIHEAEGIFNKHGYISAIAVAKEYQRRNIGTLLVDFAKEVSKNEQCTTLNVEPFVSDNLDPFLSKLGFVKGGLPTFYPGEKYDEHTFQLKENYTK